MNHKTFIKMIEDYYGKYDLPTRKVFVENYISSYNEVELDKIFDRLVLTYSGQYKHVPDVAILDGIVIQINTELEPLVGGKKMLIGYRPPQPVIEEDTEYIKPEEVEKLTSQFWEKVRAKSYKPMA